MNKTLFKYYAIKDLKESDDEFSGIQIKMAANGIPFTVILQHDSLGIIAHKIEETSYWYNYLKMKGFKEIK